MSTSALKTLTIEHLRGSVRPFALGFEKGKKLTVVYGENASGKSTICDAFEFLGKGMVGSLENRGLGKTARYWPSVGKKSTDVSVTLETADSKCTGTIPKGEVVIAPPQARPHVEVLRRSQILSLVQAKPGDRYEAIRRFIDVSGVEESEATLRGLIRDLKESRKVAVARIQENRDSILQFWEEDGKPAPDAITWAWQESARDTAAIQCELDALAMLSNAYQRVAEYPERLRTADENRQGAMGKADTATQTLQECLIAVAEGAGELVEILQAAKPFLEQHPDPPQCPLCESSEKVAGLSGRVTERLQQFSSLQVAKREKAAADQAVQTAQKRIEDLQGEATARGQEFEQARKSSEWPADIAVPADACPARIEDLTAWIRLTSQLPQAWNAAETKRQDKKQFLSTLKRAFDTYQTNVDAQNDLDRLLPRLERALEIVAEERRTFTDGILARIAQEVGRLYEEVHPGEGLNKISLELDPKKRASLEIGAKFCGQDGPPQAYFSDSHLDTLGLCVFLALAALDNQASIILVLDDVLASVDEPHVERLIEMLYTEASKFRHCIITTHYGPWKHKLRWGWLQNGQCQLVELTKWTRTTGLTLTRSVPDVERLKQLLGETPPDPQLVSSKSGVILEAALDFLTQLYECSVPRRTSGLYTLGELLPAVDKKLRTALRVEVLIGRDAAGLAMYQTTSLTPILDELTRIAQTRNVFGCHFTALSFDLLDADAIGFGQQVAALMDALTDTEAGWPRNKKSGSYWATAGETRRLHPLTKPT